MGEWINDNQKDKRMNERMNQGMSIFKISIKMNTSFNKILLKEESRLKK